MEDARHGVLPARYTLWQDGEAKATVDRPSRNRDAVDALVAAFQAAVSASIKASSIAAA
jgi:hypothetical protein